MQGRVQRGWLLPLPVQDSPEARPPDTRQQQGSSRQQGTFLTEDPASHVTGSHPAATRH